MNSWMACQLLGDRRLRRGGSDRERRACLLCVPLWLLGGCWALERQKNEDGGDTAALDDLWVVVQGMERAEAKLFEWPSSPRRDDEPLVFWRYDA